MLDATRLDDVVLVTITCVYVLLYALRACVPLPALLVRHGLSVRYAAMAFVSLVPLSCLVLKDTLGVMAVATVVTLSYGDYLVFSSEAEDPPKKSVGLD